jgi:hypothetical protein
MFYRMWTGQGRTEGSEPEANDTGTAHVGSLKKVQENPLASLQALRFIPIQSHDAR